MALQMHLEGRFGDIDADILGNGSVFIHINLKLRMAGKLSVLTLPYACELTAEAVAQATVRVWSTGHVRLLLGYGLAKGHPRVERARTRHRCLLRRGAGLFTLPKQGKWKGWTKPAFK